MDSRFPKVLAAGVLLAAGALLAAGCSPDPAPSPAPAPAGNTVATAPAPAVPPRPDWNRPAFAPEPPAGAARRPAEKPSPFVLVRADGTPYDGDLPEIPVPAGWVPAKLDFGDDEGPVFNALGDEVIDIPAAPAEPVEEYVGEEVLVETVVYEDAVEVGTNYVSIGTPVLVVEGWSSWGCGPFPAVRGCGTFDPCWTPPRGACWEPLPYDPCWNPCADPAWRSWNSFANACEDRDLRPPHRRIGLETGSGAQTSAYDPRETPGTIFRPAPAAPAALPDLGGPGAGPVHGGAGAAWAPAEEEAGLGTPDPAAREAVMDRLRGGADGTAAALDERPRLRRIIPGARRPAPPEPDATATAAAAPAEDDAGAAAAPFDRRRPDRTDREDRAVARESAPAYDPEPAAAPARVHESPRAIARDRDDDAPAAAPASHREERRDDRRERQEQVAEERAAARERAQERAEERRAERAERHESRRADPAPAPAVEVPAARAEPAVPVPAPEPQRHHGNGGRRK
jgi:hypothetical protein